MKYFTLLKLIDKARLILRIIQLMIDVARQCLNVYAEATRDLQMVLHFLLFHSFRRNYNFVDRALFQATGLQTLVYYSF